MRDVPHMNDVLHCGVHKPLTTHTWIDTHLKLAFILSHPLVSTLSQWVSGSLKLSESEQFLIGSKEILHHWMEIWVSNDYLVWNHRSLIKNALDCHKCKPSGDPKLKFDGPHLSWLKSMHQLYNNQPHTRDVMWTIMQWVPPTGDKYVFSNPWCIGAY